MTRQSAASSPGALRTHDLPQPAGPDAAPCRPSAVLYYGAKGGGAVWRHAGGGVAIYRGVGPHQEGAAIYGVLPLLSGRRQVWHGTGGVGNIGLQPVSHGGHLAGHHGDPVS